MTSFLDQQMAVRQIACHAWTNSLSCLDQQLFMPWPTASHVRDSSKKWRHHLTSTGQWHHTWDNRWYRHHTRLSDGGNITRSWSDVICQSAGNDVAAASSCMWRHDWRTEGSDDLPGLAAGGKGSASMVSYFEKPVIIFEGISIV